MALRKVADYRFSIDGGAGYILFKIFLANGTVSDWIGWNYVPIVQLPALQNLLGTHNAYYDDQTKIFTSGPVTPHLGRALALNPIGIINPIVAENSKKTKKKKS